MSDIEEIRARYRRRETIPLSRYSLFNRATLFLAQERERHFLRALRSFGIDELRDKRILDIGCGAGGWLMDLLRYGADRNRIHGIDLIESRVELAKSRLPGVDIRLGSATVLEFPSDYFDIVIVATVFTSIPTTDMKRQVAREMTRVVRKDGVIVWYDFRFDNPSNVDVSGIGKKEIYALFPELSLRFRTLTLAPPIARFVAPWSWLTCEVLSRVPFLRSHYMALISPKACDRNVDAAIG